MKKKLLKTIIFSLFLSLFAFRVWQASGCISFKSFLFDNQRITTNVETSRQYEKNPDGLISRATHNKFTAAPYEFGLNISALLGSKYLLDLIGPLGFAAALIAIYYIITQRLKLGFIYLAILALAQIRATLFTSSKTDMLIFVMFLESKLFYKKQRSIFGLCASMALLRLVFLYKLANAGNL